MKCLKKYLVLISICASKIKTTLEAYIFGCCEWFKISSYIFKRDRLMSLDYV